MHIQCTWISRTQNCCAHAQVKHAVKQQPEDSQQAEDDKLTELAHNLKHLQLLVGRKFKDPALLTTALMLLGRGMKGARASFCCDVKTLLC